MTRYELYKKIARALAGENAEALFDYIIHSMDDNGGFLRSRWCYWEKTLPDGECNGEIKNILVTLREPFDFMNSTEYYEVCGEEIFAEKQTSLKMQIFLYDLSDEEERRQEAEWSEGVGFGYPMRVVLH